MRWLSGRLDVDPAYLSRAVRGADGKRMSPELLARITTALDLPPDYFVEAREKVVVDAVRDDGQLRDQIYDALQRRRR